MGNLKSKNLGKNNSDKFNEKSLDLFSKKDKSSKIYNQGEISFPKKEGDIPIMINPDVLVEKSSKSPFDYYTIISKIKESFNDEVLKVKNIITGYDCVMKQIIKRHNTTITEEMEIINEIEMMKKLDHPNLIKIFQFFSTPESYFIIMENCEGGELYDEIIKNGPFNEDQAAFILYQMFSAIFYCHSNNIIHRDLKPENIVIEKKEENR